MDGRQPRTDRDRFAQLLTQLIGDDAGGDDAGRPGAATAGRVLSHALLNFLETTGADRAHPLADALPWLGAYVAWSRGEASADAVAARLAAAPGVRALSPTMIAQRMGRNPAASTPGGDDACARVTSRQPRPADLAECRLATLNTLVDLEHHLSGLLDAEPAGVRHRLQDDTALLAAAVELLEQPGGPTEVAQLLAEHLATPAPGSSDSLWMLAALEADEAMVNPLAHPDYGLSARAQNFERGLARSMADQGISPAVRLAMAFDADGSGAELLRAFPAVRDDAALGELTAALVAVRGRCIDVLRGGCPTSALDGWVAYLRGGCVELAEVRHISLREAMSLAHYCLHLLDICDLAAMPVGRAGEALNPRTRQALGDIEDELKEVAQAGLQGGSANLARLQAARWRSRGPAAYLADRLARLRGAWRKGTEPGPVGAPPRLDSEAYGRSLALVESLADRCGQRVIDSLGELAGRCRLVGYAWLEHLEAEDVLKVLAAAVALARDLPGVDVSASFTVDLGAIGGWLGDARSGGLNRRVLTTLLGRRTLAEVLDGEGASPHVGSAVLGRGLVGRVVDGRVALSFSPDAELRSLLDLMSRDSSDDPGFREVLEGRLDALLERRASAAPPAESAVTTSQSTGSGSRVVTRDPGA